jgi:hypothetical protein
MDRVEDWSSYRESCKCTIRVISEWIMHVENVHVFASKFSHEHPQEPYSSKRQSAIVSAPEMHYWDARRFEFRLSFRVIGDIVPAAYSNGMPGLLLSYGEEPHHFLQTTEIQIGDKVIDVHRKPEFGFAAG